MGAMSTPEAIFEARQPIRPLKRIEYDRLVAEGFFQDERVELLFGMVVPMSPVDPAHEESSYRIQQALKRQLGIRARVRGASPLAASDVSEPQPDISVIPERDYWDEHPAKAFLVVEVARSSLRKDKGPKALLYGFADVDEYWIVNHVDEVVEVYRDRHNGEWRHRSTHRRGDTVEMAAFAGVTLAVSEILPPLAK